MINETMELVSCLSLLWLGTYIFQLSRPDPIDVKSAGALIEWDPVAQSK